MNPAYKCPACPLPYSTLSSPLLLLAAPPQHPPNVGVCRELGGGLGSQQGLGMLGNDFRWQQLVVGKELLPPPFSSSGSCKGVGVRGLGLTPP